MTKSRICVGADDDLVTPSEGDCTKPIVTGLNEGLTLDLTCVDAQGNKQSISASFTGNFDERYHATLKTNFDPPLGGIPHMGVREISRAGLPRGASARREEIAASREPQDLLDGEMAGHDGDRHRKSAGELSARKRGHERAGP